MHIGVDTGGTFTDLVLWDGRRLHLQKVLSTPPDYSAGVLRGIREILDQASAAGRAFDVTHSATVATNALLERRGSRTALITTRGFRDVLEIGRQTRPALYDFRARKLAPLVPRPLRRELSERVDAAGRVLLEPDPREIDRILKILQGQGVESIAVCFLFSFLHPRHERAVSRAARRRGLAVSISSDVVAEFREYERTSTTVVNAYVAPVMQRYLRQLDRALRKLGTTSWRVVQSNGGSLSPARAAAGAARTLLSGPAAGVVGARAAARQALGAPHRRHHTPNLITFDMGGTSTDVSLITRDFEITLQADIGGCPIRLPMMNIHTVGAGGGSIAYLDDGGALHVGPRSAGADPGPACYGTADHVTVTDANLVLGRIHPAHFLGGRMTLHADRAREALGRLGRELGTTPRTAARAVIRVVNANMERALRLISIERGHDPRECTLVCFGGAGGLHACELAAALQIPRILLPRNPGVLSAWGALAGDVIKDYSQTLMIPAAPATLRKVKRTMNRFERQARRDLAGEAPARAAVTLEPFLDLRYAGQSHELTVPFTGGLAGTIEAFHDLHHRRYGHDDRSAAVQIVTARLRATAATAKPAPGRIARGGTSARRAIISTRGAISCYERDLLRAGNCFRGPALILEPFASAWLPRGWRAGVDPWGHLTLTPLESA